eukprot:5741669-Prymnesium_polylepis.2
MCVLERHRAALGGGRAVIVRVHPYVRRILDAPRRRQALVVGHRLVDVRVRIRHRRPQHGAPLDGGHRHVEVRKARAAALLGRREVHKKGVEPRALRREQARVLQRDTRGAGTHTSICCVV